MTLETSYTTRHALLTHHLEMALLSAPQLSLKLPTQPLLPTLVLIWFLIEIQAFQWRSLPIFGGAQFHRWRPCSNTPETAAGRCADSSRRQNHARKLYNEPTRDQFLPRAYNDDDKEELIEEENPEADKERWSLSGVRYGSVFDSLNILYPPTDLEKRNAVSRSDGYWPFINSGEEPPKQFTYGEFDLYFFAELLDRAFDYYNESQDVMSSTWNGKVFTDIGSGTGRLVLAAAALHPGWKLCRGVEVLEGIHNVAVETLRKCRLEIDVSSDEDVRDNNVTLSTKDASESHEGADDDTTRWKTFGAPFDTTQDDYDWLDQLKQQYDDTPPLEIAQDLYGESESTEEDTSLNGIEENTHELKDAEEENMHIFILPAVSPEASDEMLCLAPIQFNCGSFEDPYEYIGDSDLIFVFSSCMSDAMMSSLSKAFGRQCKPGTIIITTDYALPVSGVIEPLEDDENMPSGPYTLDLLESIDGWCWLTGGQSTAHIHRVITSLWEEGIGPREKPVIPLEEQAYRIVKAYEAGELTNTDKFLRDVRNSMIFAGLPDSWLPSMDDE